MKTANSIHLSICLVQTFIATCKGQCQGEPSFRTHNRKGSLKKIVSVFYRTLKLVNHNRKIKNGKRSRRKKKTGQLLLKVFIIKLGDMEIKKKYKINFTYLLIIYLFKRVWKSFWLPPVSKFFNSSVMCCHYLIMFLWNIVKFILKQKLNFITFCKDLNECEKYKLSPLLTLWFCTHNHWQFRM